MPFAVIAQFCATKSIFSQNKRIIICVRNCPNLLQRIGLQLVDRVLEILKILKILVYTGESHIRDLIKITQRFQNGFADLIRLDLGKTSSTKVLFNLLPERLQIVFLDRATLACFSNAGNHLVPIELFDVAGTLHHQQHGGLQRSETLGTFRALSPTANGVAVIADAGIDHLGIWILTKRAMHDVKNSLSH